MNSPTPSRIWHPMTQHAVMGPEIHIDRAQGAYLYTKDSREILDGIASWWVITHGHCHPKIVQAVQEQAPKLEQVIFAGFTHDPAEETAAKLLQMTQDPLEYVFFSDSGSTAIEVALKMAIGYWEHRGKPRHKIIALEGGYHGDTFGAMSAGARGVFNKLYEPYLFEVQHIPFPKTGNEEKSLQQLEDILKQEGDNIAAFIFEPLAQGAAGMQMCTPETLKSMHDLCKTKEVLLIADEVMTGFGRTGTMFACEQAGFAPDLMALSKGLTGGFLPMGATLCTSDIYNAFYQKDRSKTFFHSTSFTGNPLACVAAKAAMDIFEDEPVMERIQNISQNHKKAAARFSKREDVSDVRHMGTLFALDVRDKTGGYLSDMGPKLYESFLSQDVLLRPIGNTVYILPPYCVENQDLERIYDSIDLTLDRIRDERQKSAA